MAEVLNNQRTPIMIKFELDFLRLIACVWHITLSVGVCRLEGWWAVCGLRRRH